MAPSRWDNKIPPLPASIPAEAVTDYACEKCGHTMRIRRSWEGHWFYGCSRWPECHFTFDADQMTGAPVIHTRHGIPFRSGKTRLGLFEALKKDAFSLEAGEQLERARKKSVASRKRALRDIDRDQVQARISKAGPSTAEEWLEFVLTERQQAVTDYRAELNRQKLALSKPRRRP